MFRYDDTPAPPPLQPPPWADLDANLVACIVGLCTLKDYASCRAVCASWHAALPPLLSQPIAVLPADDGGHHPVSLAVCLLHTRRWHRIPGLRQPAWLDAAHCRCVGARDGWLALVAGDDVETSRRAVLFNPFTGGEIPLDATLYEPNHDLAPKIVFSPNPTRHDFVAVSLCRRNRLVLQKAYGGGSLTFIEDTEALMDKAVLVDLAYGEDDNVYCLTTEGHVYRLRFRRRLRDRKSPLHVQPLLSDHAEAADAFPPPYDAIAGLAEAKNLALCNGVLYQVWRRPAGAGNATIDAPPVPGAGGRRQRASVYEGEVFVLRHDPTNRPHCWAVVEGKDLGGAALFVGMNDAVAVRGRGVCRNSVHYWNVAADDGGYDPVVYSVARGFSVRWPAATGGLSSPVWYIMPVVGRRHNEGGIVDAEETCLESDDDEDSRVYDRFRSKKTLNMLLR